jgi:hypothetical protein
VPSPSISNVLPSGAVTRNLAIWDRRYLPSTACWRWSRRSRRSGWLCFGGHSAATPRAYTLAHPPTNSGNLFLQRFLPVQEVPLQKVDDAPDLRSSGTVSDDLLHFLAGGIGQYAGKVRLRQDTRSLGTVQVHLRVELGNVWIATNGLAARANPPFRYRDACGINFIGQFYKYLPVADRGFLESRDRVVLRCDLIKRRCICLESCAA